MKVLGKELVSPFDAFWERFASEIDIPVYQIEQGHRAVFRQAGYQEGSSKLPRWMGLPDGALSFHVAHELTHIAMRKRGFPATMRGPQYGEDSPEARVGTDLEEMIGHPALEGLLRPFPFDKSHIQQHLFQGGRSGLERSSVPEKDTPWWVTWACRFCELQFLLTEQQWLRLEVVYDGRCPDIADKGRDLAEIMRQEGFLTPDQALQAMIRTRDALDLKEDDRCLVLDPRDGEVY